MEKTIADLLEPGSNAMSNEGLLAEVEDLLRSSPPQSAFTAQEPDEALSWLGRTSAVINKWNVAQGIACAMHARALLAEESYSMITPPGPAYRGLRTLLFQAQHDLQMKTGGALSVAIDAKKPFVYFDEIRKIIEVAREDLLFVDPYLDAEFVSRYLPQVASGVTVRLLTSKKLPSLLPAVELFVGENKRQVQVHSMSDLHDRYVFVDEARCYQSGASFKDGAKKSLTTLTQITDTFDEVFQAYQRMWDDAKVEEG